MRKVFHQVNTIHGIHTDADLWPHKLGAWMAAHEGGVIDVHPIDWGWLSATQMYLGRLVPLWHNARVNRVARCLRDTAFIPEPQHIVAHSFGTWLAVEALTRNPDLKIETLTLIGSILSNQFAGSKLAALLASGQLQRVLVLWSPNDWIVRHLCQWPYGKLGATGFEDVERASSSFVSVDVERASSSFVPVAANDQDGRSTSNSVRQLRTAESHSTYFWQEFRELYFREIADFIKGA